MKNNTYFIAIFLLFSISNIFAKQLEHICAYSNKSVARFRQTTLQNLGKAEKPGVHFDWPIDLCSFWISSLYGQRKDAAGQKKMHYGVDMAAAEGTLVKSVADGVVISVQKNDSGYGNMIEVEHKNNLISRYAHLSKVKVKVGVEVHKGSVVGTVGSTGNVRGKNPSHLHFELIKNGKRINPLKYLYWSEIGFKKVKNSV